MKYLKTYKIYEWNSKPIPDNFIELKSIGHVLDPDEGIVYAMFKKGGYDHENPYYVEDELQNLSDEDMELVNDYITYSKDVINIDNDFMDNIKEILLELIDNHYKVSIGVEANTIHVLTKLFGTRRDWEHYVDLFANHLKMVESSEKYLYTIRIKGNYSSMFQSNISDEDIIDSIVRLISFIDESKYSIKTNSMGAKEVYCNDRSMYLSDDIEKSIRDNIGGIKHEFNISLS